MRRIHYAGKRAILRCCAILVAGGLAACSSPSASTTPAASEPSSSNIRHRMHRAAGQANPLQHIIVVVQENRSLNNIFAGFPGAYTTMSGKDSHGNTIPLTSVSLANPQDISHFWMDAKTAYDGGLMDRFDQERFVGGGNAGTFPYAYVNRTEVAPYWAIASSWVLADQFFPTEFGSSFTAHLNLIAGTTQTNPTAALVNNPYLANTAWGCDANPGTVTYLVQPSGNVTRNGPFPCLTQFHTLADTMDAAGVSWRYYAPKPTNWIHGGIWSIFDAISNVRNGPDWANVNYPPSKFLTDIQGGTLADVTWVIPDFADSDHAGSAHTTGPSWVASVVNAVGTSKFWSTSAVVILWDDWGGWYDASPPAQPDFRGLGIRTPLLVVSPYAKIGSGGSGSISHVDFEPGSIMRLIETTFGLPTLASKYGTSLGYTDGRATGLGSVFDFTQTPRPFGSPIPAQYGPSYFEGEAASAQPPDDYTDDPLYSQNHNHR